MPYDNFYIPIIEYYKAYFKRLSRVLTLKTGDSGIWKEESSWMAIDVLNEWMMVARNGSCTVIGIVGEWAWRCKMNCFSSWF